MSRCPRAEYPWADRKKGGGRDGDCSDRRLRPLPLAVELFLLMRASPHWCCLGRRTRSMRPAGAQLCRAPEFCSTSLETASPPKVEGRLANRHSSLLLMFPNLRPSSDGSLAVCEDPRAKLPGSSVIRPRPGHIIRRRPPCFALCLVRRRWMVRLAEQNGRIRPAGWAGTMETAARSRGSDGRWYSLLRRSRERQAASIRERFPAGRGRWRRSAKPTIGHRP
jgi:hypothetical protein